MQRNRLQLRAVQGELKGALDQVQAFCAAHRLPAKSANAMMVAVDELLSNIVKFAYGPSEHGVIDVDLTHAGGKLTVVIEDRGRPFDPLKLQRPEMAGELARRTEGGLGIYFVKNLIDDVHYERQGDCNRVTLTISAPDG